MLTQMKSSTMTMLAAAAAFSTGLVTQAEACQYSNHPVLTQLSEATLRARGVKPFPMASEGAAAHESGPASIVGLWHLVISVNRQPVDEAFELFHSDGTEMLIDQTPPVMGNSCVGVYEQSALRVYTLSHPFWAFDAAGNLTGSGMITSTITLSKDGNAFAGTSTEDVFDLKGKNVAHTTAQIEGTRIRP